MIIWLASYPKSGNTFLRAFLSAYYFSSDGKFDFSLIDNIKQFPDKQFFNKKIDSAIEASKEWMLSQKKIISDKKIRFFKTHSCLGDYKGNVFTSFETSLGAIYIVRDPRNVFTSIKNHFSYNDEEALNMILDKKSYLLAKDGGGYSSYSYISSWSLNYLSWLKYNKFRRLFIKYEDILENKYETFRDIIVFINTLTNRIEGVNKSKLHNAIESTNFNVLKKKEKDVSMGESDDGFKKWRNFHVENRNYFFNLGPDNKWENILNKHTREKIESNFKNEMKSLKYI
ncbi:sulfotransferase domain-containing protein [Candidatus Pelagibacter sp.]|uniref:sulfotransferase domain-containing protein n=1 Tax=Candidatus Pelagibacter sp. TaxID=2024849 RepID=UPI003D14BCF1